MSTDELPDETVLLQSHEDALYLDLMSVDLPDEDPGPGDLITRFAEIDEEAGSDKEKLLMALTRLFATYVVANEIFAAGSMRTPKTITDSEASLTRFSAESTHELVAANIQKKLAGYRYRIVHINDTAIIDETPLLTLVGNGTDPVTNT